jgi:hypothetical protein
MLRLHVVVLLRKAGYNFSLIKSGLTELEAGFVDRAVAAVEARLAILSAASRNCTASTAALWKYPGELQVEANNNPS